MSYDTVNYDDVEPIADGMHFLRDPLDCEELGLTVVECEPGWTGKPHDHDEDGEEEIYLLVDGRATLTVEDEAVAMTEGDAVRVDPSDTRQIENGDAESTFVIAGAP